MSIQVNIHEAKGLSNLSGRIKARAAIVETAGAYGRPKELDVQSSRSVEEYTHVKFDDAAFNL